MTKAAEKSLLLYCNYRFRTLRHIVTNSGNIELPVLQMKVQRVINITSW
jgi:hypothetical protein